MTFQALVAFATLFSLELVLGIDNIIFISILLTAPLFTVFTEDISGRDLILLVGGAFLIAKSTHEIHAKLESGESEMESTVAATVGSVLIQILLLDVVFSLDSVITAIGMVDQIAIMVAAVLASALVMVLTAKTISDFVDRNPTIKILALSFLIMIGVSLIAEGLDHHIPKGYIYFSMAFSLFVEVLNIRFRKKREPLQLKRAW